MNAPPLLLVAGIGNIFLGDDAFGSEVAQRLLRRPQPAGVQVVDFGIRALDLTYALLDGCQTAILIDAVPRGQPPGTLYVIEPEMPTGARATGTSACGVPITDGHTMNPVQVLQAVAAMGGGPGRVLLVGCEPTPINSDEDMSMEFSAAVGASLDPAVQLVESLIRQTVQQLPHQQITHIQQELQSC